MASAMRACGNKVVRAAAANTPGLVCVCFCFCFFFFFFLPYVRVSCTRTRTTTAKSATVPRWKSTGSVGAWSARCKRLAHVLLLYFLLYFCCHLQTRKTIRRNSQNQLDNTFLILFFIWFKMATCMMENGSATHYTAAGGTCGTMAARSKVTGAMASAWAMASIGMCAISFYYHCYYYDYHYYFFIIIMPHVARWLRVASAWEMTSIGKRKNILLFGCVCVIITVFLLKWFWLILHYLFVVVVVVFCFVLFCFFCFFFCMFDLIYILFIFFLQLARWQPIRRWFWRQQTTRMGHYAVCVILVIFFYFFCLSKKKQTNTEMNTDIN